MPPHAPGAADAIEDLADLEKLAAELIARGYQADVRTPEGKLPYLDVRNPNATVLAERVYAQAGAFWFSWAEKIADSDQIAVTAGILVRVLRAVDE